MVDMRLQEQDIEIVAVTMKNVVRVSSPPADLGREDGRKMAWCTFLHQISRLIPVRAKAHIFNKLIWKSVPC